MIVPTQLTLNLLQALQEGARALDTQLNQGDLLVYSLDELVHVLLDNHPEKDVADFYREAIVDKLESDPLTAAAPDLLAALEISIQLINQLCDTVNTIDRSRGGNGRKVFNDDFTEPARAAIAKAKGQKP